MSDIRIKTLDHQAIEESLDALAVLRIQVFYDYPYLYKGDLDYEREYLSHYLNDTAVFVGAYDGDRLVGVATASAANEHAEAFSRSLESAGYDPGQLLYCGESVLLPEYRGRGIGHRFFDERENHGRFLGLAYSCFSAVVRPDDHPLKPKDYQPLDSFWRKRGYQRLDNVIAHFSWQDIDQPAETEKPMQFWLKPL
ncbi:GNAT family N-acetyltransferase [Nitrincola alkalilacustris]|uniref:GNAT family N-acetyltransferase n=1 Tax=Nitrincola alkalilacustris TaxID=1571224 RepID=UPI00124F12E5|nr:GNAT family N-acetyltransferase [Nitrincola alkalilacustris]